MLPKPNSDGKDITKARPIAVGNCDGKLYNSFLQEAIATHTLAKFPFQKGFLRGVPGCIEHASIAGEALKDTKMNKRNLVFVWVDLADAFGSVEHQLIFFAMEYFGISKSVIDFFKFYYSKLRVQIRVKDELTEPVDFESGVFQRCVVSPTLFNLVFQLLLATLACFKDEAYHFSLKNTEEKIDLLLAAFADDLQITTSTKAGSKVLLKQLSRFLSWSKGMRAKTQKCVAHSFENGKPCNPNLEIDGKDMKEFKYLGRWFEPDQQEKELKKKNFKTGERFPEENR